MAAIDVAGGDGCAGDGGGSGERQFEDGAGELEGAGLWVFVFNARYLTWAAGWLPFSRTLQSLPFQR